MRSFGSGCRRGGHRCWAHDQASTLEDFDKAEHTLNTLQEMVERQLSRHPFAYRKAASNPLPRELVMDLGHTGHVALYEIESANRVNILAVRHQREDDYHGPATFFSNWLTAASWRLRASSRLRSAVSTVFWAASTFR